VQLITRQSHWITNGGPTTCAFCGQPFPYDPQHTRIEAQVGADERLYCFAGTCEFDALEAAGVRRRRVS
jgi:hypothetical protein